jgi:hypothetical protein
MPRRLLFRLALVVLVVVAVWIGRWEGPQARPDREEAVEAAVTENPAARTAAGGISEGSARLTAAIRNGESGVWVEADGVVDRLLPDDEEGAGRQRFLLRLDSGETLEVSHNLGVAPRVKELEAGDRVSFRGEYEWNDEGGVVDWTHHDPHGRHEGGWLELDGRRHR